MRAANFDDVGESLTLGMQGGAQLGNGGQQLGFNGRDCRHVHGGGVHIVAGLAFVHIVIGVHHAAFTALTAQQLAGAVGQHLIDVHIGLCARAGLPDHQRKFVGVLTGQHFIGGGVDGAGRLGIEQAQRTVDRGAGFLDLRQRRNDFARLLLAADVKVLQ